MGIEAVKMAASTSNVQTSYQGSAASEPVSKPASVTDISTIRRNSSYVEDISVLGSSETEGAASWYYTPDEETTQERRDVQNKSIREAVDKINQRANTEAIFGIHDKTGRVTIKIVDKESKDVIKEVPPEKTLDMIAKVWEMAGILVDEKK